jgi:integrase
VLLALLWETGIRIGSANSIDLQDVYLQDEYIDLVHRPDTGTTLKNGKTGERPVAITSGLADVLGEYIEHRRIDIDDESDRKPLLTSENGRYSNTGIRMRGYRMTAPCFRDEPCPDCNQGLEEKCPEAVSPHAIRRGSITHFLTNDVPEDVVSDRMNVSRKVPYQHYHNTLQR